MALPHGGMRAATHPLSSTQNRASVFPASYLGGPGKPMGGGRSVAGRGYFVPFWGGYGGVGGRKREDWRGAIMKLHNSHTMRQLCL